MMNNNTNVRLIASNRPGYGRTDFVEGVTTLENWPNDVLALADASRIEQKLYSSLARRSDLAFQKNGKHKTGGMNND